jgi:hypothetical protein
MERGINFQYANPDAKDKPIELSSDLTPGSSHRIDKLNFDDEIALHRLAGKGHSPGGDACRGLKNS